jgi:hypothetical protein
MKAAPMVRILAVLLAASASTGGAQVRTPIAPAPVRASSAPPGPAPMNARATVSSSAATVAWDANPLIRLVEIQRTRIDNVICCVRQSGVLTTAYWNDSGLEPGYQYLYQITARYTDGRSGATQIIVSTPLQSPSTLPTARTPRNATMASADGVLRLTPCGAKSGALPAPTGLKAGGGTPAGGKLEWTIVPGVNYVVDRTPEATESWTLVGSSCGGPSPLKPNAVVPTVMTIQDIAGGLTGNVIYRVTAVSGSGQVGWNSVHWSPPCKGRFTVTPTVTGSSVKLDWTFIRLCALSVWGEVALPDVVHVASSFGYAGDQVGAEHGSVVVDGVPRGTHTFTLTGIWYPDASMSASFTVVVQF